MSLAWQLTCAVLGVVGALGGLIWSGITHRRSIHYACVVALLAFLALAIWRAEELGRGLLFEGTALTVHRIHFGAVIGTFLSLALVGVTGVRLARSRAADARDPRHAHKRQAEIFVLLVLITSALGTAMTWLATRN